jgi:hypothetical protein
MPLIAFESIPHFATETEISTERLPRSHKKPKRSSGLLLDEDGRKWGIGEKKEILTFKMNLETRIET